MSLWMQKRPTLKCSCGFGLKRQWRYCPRCASPLNEEQKAKPKRTENQVSKDALTRVFNLWVRLRDCPNGWGNCISCGHPVRFENTDAGHFIGCEIIPTKWEPKNVNAQCRYCNQYKEGLKDRYAEGLEKKYGPGTVDKLRLQASTGKKIPAYERRVMAAHYKAEIERMTEGK